jgi:phosphohistidine phosphatase SixA
MHLIMCRHGEPKRGSDDPGLTSFGRQIVEELALTLKQLELRPTHIQSTSAKRCKESAAILGVLFNRETEARLSGLPETLSDWTQFLYEVEEQYAPLDIILLVGHHPTNDMLKKLYHLSDYTNYFASTIIVHNSHGQWVVNEHWSGRPSFPT